MFSPSLVGIFIGLLKDTSLAFIVNVPELTTVAGQVNNRVQIYPLAIFGFHRRGVLPAVLRSRACWPVGVLPAARPPDKGSLRGTGLHRAGIADLNKICRYKPDSGSPAGAMPAGEPRSPGRRYHASPSSSVDRIRV